MEDEPLPFQALLFGDDAEARAAEVERISKLEQQKAYSEARKLAWESGHPFPVDVAKWSVTHRDVVNARSREGYRQRHSEMAEYYLRSAARSRAERLGCKIGRRRPILTVYRRAVHAPILLCFWCKRLTFPGERHVDHITPLSAGGTHTAGNLCVTCIECNVSKGDSSPEEFRLRIADKRTHNKVIAQDYFRQAAKAAPQLRP
jgi:5-methylcytosine-specific restriction endonuclease McrA